MKEIEEKGEKNEKDIGVRELDQLARQVAGVVTEYIRKNRDRINYDRERVHILLTSILLSTVKYALYHGDSPVSSYTDVVEYVDGPEYLPGEEYETELKKVAGFNMNDVYAIADQIISKNPVFLVALLEVLSTALLELYNNGENKFTELREPESTTVN